MSRRHKVRRSDGKLFLPKPNRWPMKEAGCGNMGTTGMDRTTAVVIPERMMVNDVYYPMIANTGAKNFVSKPPTKDFKDTQIKYFVNTSRADTPTPAGSTIALNPLDTAQTRNIQLTKAQTDIANYYNAQQSESTHAVWFQNDKSETIAVNADTPVRAWSLAKPRSYWGT